MDTIKSVLYVIDPVKRGYVPLPISGESGGVQGITSFLSGEDLDNAIFNDVNVVNILDGGILDASTTGLVTASVAYGYDDITGEVYSLSMDLEETDALDASFIYGGLRTSAFMMGYNGATYDRVRSFGVDANNITPPTLGIPGSLSFLYGVNVNTGAFDRVGVEGTDTDSHIERNSGAVITASHPHLWSEEGFDRERNNHGHTHLASAARTATESGADTINYNARGGHFVIDVSAVTGAASITVDVEAKDPVSGVYYSLLNSAAISTVSTVVLKIYPGITPVANAAASDILPREYRVTVTHANADSITYSVSDALVN
jgi:hypothetical protein